ncbi:unnamed protein product, partial [Candidula unifasciata]
WAYTGIHGASHWAAAFPTCGKDQQSPIDILEGDIRFDKELPPIKYSNYNTTLVLLSGSTPVTVSAGGLPAGVFRAFQIHLHWGITENLGSEHLLNGLAYPMELHIVHYNTKYASPGVALQNPDGLAVLGFFYEVAKEDNPSYASIVGKLPAILYSGLKTNIGSVPLNSLLPRSFKRFFRYPGSLTTPPCHESVTWTVFKDTIPISQIQLEAFRILLDPHARPMSNNFRPVQPLNHRHVSANFDPDIRWSYRGATVSTEQWPLYYSACKGDNQSPIAIPTRASRFDPKLQKLDFHNYDRVPSGQYKLTNNGHTASLDISSADASISGGGLPGTYLAARLDFHWGSHDNTGSEHTLDNRAYPMELQIVHYKKSLANLTRAVFEQEGLAVLAVFFEISAKDNPAFDTLVKSLRVVRVP